MKVLNFSHPLGAEAREALAAGGVESGAVIDIRVQLDLNRPLGEQVTRIVEGVPFSAEEWATEAFLVNLPGATVAAALVLAEVHGRSGQFPRVLSLTRGDDGVFRLGEVIDLQSARDTARLFR